MAVFVDLTDGKMTCINCGHNPPIIKRGAEDYQYLNINPNLVLGAFEDTNFEIYETKLNPDDIILLYTDGVTEALNTKDEFYGEERLLKFMNSNSDNKDVKEIVDSVKNDVAKYIESRPHSDDITLLAFKYNSKQPDVFQAPAKLENYKQFYTWLHNKCNELTLSEDFINKLDMCAEEIFANITFYAYPDETGEMKVSLVKDNNVLTMAFEDSGFAYNPLEREDPDITLPPEERPLGGLGIFMLKQMTDDIKYERKDEKNILTLYFNC